MDSDFKKSFRKESVLFLTKTKGKGDQLCHSVFFHRPAMMIKVTILKKEIDIRICFTLLWLDTFTIVG